MLDESFEIIQCTAYSHRAIVEITVRQSLGSPILRTPTGSTSIFELVSQTRFNLNTAN